MSNYFDHLLYYISVIIGIALCLVDHWSHELCLLLGMGFGMGQDHDYLPDAASVHPI